MSVVQPLLGKTVTIDVPGGTSSNSGSSGPLSVSYTLNTNGTVTVTGSTVNFPADWIDPKIQPAIDSYYVSANVVSSGSGTWSGNSFSTWIPTSSARTWTFTSSASDDAGTMNVNISPNSNGNPIVSTGLFQATISIFGGPPGPPGP